MNVSLARCTVLLLAAAVLVMAKQEEDSESSDIDSTALLQQGTQSGIEQGEAQAEGKARNDPISEILLSEGAIEPIIKDTHMSHVIYYKAHNADSLDGDLNQGVPGSKTIYLNYAKYHGSYATEIGFKTIRDVKLSAYSSCGSEPGYKPVKNVAKLGSQLNGDLNQGAGSDSRDIYLCYSTTKGSCPLKSLLVSDSSTCESGYTRVKTMATSAMDGPGLNGDLNEGAGGKYIYLCKSCLKE